MVPKRVRLLPVLLVADLFHPVNDLAVELFLYGDVRHARGRRSAVPVLLAGRERDHITRPDLLDRTAFALSPAEARGHDERLPERMRMPCSSCTGFEGCRWQIVVPQPVVGHLEVPDALAGARIQADQALSKKTIAGTVDPK
jgi:hypothetical protein